MKQSIFLLFLMMIFLQSCTFRQREEALQRKEHELNQKEQELLLKEKTLQLLEEELTQRQQKLDSIAVVDTTAKYNENLIGTWAVKMICTETTCPGSAVGDTKSETWEISYQDKNVIAKAMVNNELVRTYSGIYNGTLLELKEIRETETSNPATNIIVRLRQTGEKQLEGKREIERVGECKITYSVSMEKK